MKKIKLRYAILLLSLLLLVGCNDKNSSSNDKITKATSTNEPTTNEPEYATGSHLSDTEALNEVSANLLEEGYTLIYAGMKNDSEVLAVLKNDDDGELLFKTYDLYKGKTLKKIKKNIEDVKTDNLKVVKYLNESLFIKDTADNIYYVYDKKFDMVSTISLGEDAMFDIVSPDCSRIFYVEKLTNKVYSYNVEAMTKSLVYEFESDEQVLSIIGVTYDMNHIVYKYINTTSTYTGYADIQIEEHTSAMSENVTYVIDIANNDYVYYGLSKNPNQISFYSLDRPREIKVFNVDSEKEIKNLVYIPETNYFCTFVTGDKSDKIEVTCKLYDRIQGVLVEKTSFIHEKNPGASSDIKRDISISPNTELICVYEQYGDEPQVFIWNMQIPSGAIEDNLPLEF